MARDSIIRRMLPRAAGCAIALTITCSLAAADLLDASRRAVAGGQTLPPVRTLRMIGRLRQAADRDATIDGIVEIRVLLPDRFIRIDRVGTERRVSGFDRGRVLSTGTGRTSDRLKLERRQLSHLMLGALAVVVSDEGVDVRAVGEEAFPDTRTLDVTAKSWSVRFVMDVATAMPMRLVYFGTGRGATITSFADRRDIDGYLFPHRITTTTSERVLETLMFDEVLLNPPLGDADFRG